MKKNRMLLTALTAALLLSAISCGGETSGQTETQPDVSDTDTAAETEETNPAPAFLPAGYDLGGETVHILHAQQVTATDWQNEVNYPVTDVEPGDIIAEAVYKRTLLCEEALNVHIVGDKINYEDLEKTVMEAAISGDPAFSAVCGRVSALAVGVPPVIFATSGISERSIFPTRGGIRTSTTA